MGIFLLDFSFVPGNREDLFRGPERKEGNELMSGTDSPTPLAWMVYILRCKDGSLYTGITKDFERRLDQHQKGLASRFTRARLPVVQVYEETGFDHSGALKREVGIKRLSRSGKLELIKKARKSSGL